MYHLYRSTLSTSIVVCFILVLSHPAYAGDLAGNSAENSDTTQPVHEPDFFYVPPADPGPDDPRFHTGGFLFIADSATNEAGVIKGKIIPLSYKPQLVNSREKDEFVIKSEQASIPIATATPTPTVTAPPTSTPLPTSTPIMTEPPATASTDAYSSPPQHQLYPAESNTNPGIVLISGTYIQISLSDTDPTDTDIEDPQFYRGSFDFNLILENPVSAEITKSPAPSISAAVPSVSSPQPLETTSATSGAASHEIGTSFDTLLPSYYERTPLPVFGNAMYYNPGIMDHVLNYRVETGQSAECSECAGYAALLRSGDLNRKVWIRWPDGTVEGPFLVIDVAAKQHVSLLIERGWVIDVDYDTAMRHGMNRPLPVTVYENRP